MQNCGSVKNSNCLPHGPNRRSNAQSAQSPFCRFAEPFSEIGPNASKGPRLKPADRHRAREIDSNLWQPFIRLRCDLRPRLARHASLALRSKENARKPSDPSRKNLPHGQANPSYKRNRPSRCSSRFKVKFSRNATCVFSAKIKFMFPECQEGTCTKTTPFFTPIRHEVSRTVEGEICGLVLGES